MRQAVVRVGWLALVFAMACKGSAPPPSGTGGARVTSPCSGSTCTIMLKQTGSTCTVEPALLSIPTDTTVIWQTAVSAQTARVVFTPKAPPSIMFQNGPPGSINRGASYNAGKATGASGDNYTYTVRFAGPMNQNVCPPIDPEICIKPGGIEPDTNCE